MYILDRYMYILYTYMYILRTYVYICIYIHIQICVSFFQEICAEDEGEGADLIMPLGKKDPSALGEALPRALPNSTTF